jgi:hypothetical protein
MYFTCPHKLWAVGQVQDVSPEDHPVNGGPLVEVYSSKLPLNKDEAFDQLFFAQCARHLTQKLR